MKITDLNGKNVCILGFGREGRATLTALKHFAPNSRITIADRNPISDIDPTIPSQTGPNYVDDLPSYDIIIKSPGVIWQPPPAVAAKVTNATELFLNSLPTGAITIGITGTKGKSSTASLIYHIILSHRSHTYLAGNIGQPMLDLLPNAKPNSVYVLELSSAQLADLTTSPQIAVVTSFFPDHADYHGSLENYFEAKTHIARYQTTNDVIFFNGDSQDCRRLAKLSPGKQLGFSGDSAAHSNIAAARAVATYLGIPDAAIDTAITTAPNLPHRQQSLGIHHGIEWVDDSAATTPQSTLAALSALAGRVDTLIVGGLDRNYDFTELASQIVASKISNLIIFPDTGPDIQRAIESLQPSRSLQYFETSAMTEAVVYAAKHTAEGKICLLSSGAPSYNLYKNFDERGDAFGQAVATLEN